jgi:O-glycosyl hydrolase
MKPKGIAAAFILLSVQLQAQQQAAVQIDFAQTRQVIRNFGASDAWSCKYIGQWPEAKKEAIADWLFSMDTLPGGQPKGIGLSLWRFNIGAGSAQQGDSSGIANAWRREESFWEPDGSWNFRRQAGQLWFLQAARKRGVRQYLGFLNSPPVQLTINGKAFAAGGRCNIAPAAYGAMAEYIAKVIRGVQQTTGVLFDYISPVNEPQWDWSDGGQEGCPYTNAEVAGVVKQLDAKLAAAKLPTRILVPESGKLNYLYAADDKPGKGYQVNAFFHPDSATYLGGLRQVYPAIAAHSYFTTSPDSLSTQVRRQVAATIHSRPNLEFWQSEYCILGDNAGEINGNKKDLGMTAALYMARVIHNDLVVANAAAWQWWLAVSSSDYKDGLVYVDNRKDDGAYTDSKMLWTMGNYSRFVRPGARRVQALLQDSSLSKQLLVSAFKNSDNTISIVVVNNGAEAVDLRLHCLHARPAAWRSYTTSDTGNLQPSAARLSAREPVRIPARSVVTLTN